MNGRFVRFVVKWRSTARKPGDLSNIRLVIVRSSCNGKTAAKEKRLTLFLGDRQVRKRSVWLHKHEREPSRATFNITRLELII